MTTSNTNSIHFLIADDHSIVRQGIVILIEEIFETAQITHASSLHQTLTALENQPIDVVILDIQFQDGNAVEIIPTIKSQYPQTKILIFSSCDEKTHALKYLEAGANGYLNKLSDEEIIQKALRDIVTEGTYLSSNVQQLLIQKMKNPDFNQPLSKLSERELEIAKLFVKGYGNLEVAAHLDLKQNTVSTFKKRIFEKLNISNMFELLELFKD